MTKRQAQRSPATVRYTRCALAATGALLAVLMLGAVALPALAQDNGSAAGMRAFAIAPGLLTVTLNRFASAAGINLSYDAAQLDGLRSEGLHGSYAVPEGFRVLLAGTGLEAVPVDGGGYAVRRAAVQSERAPATLPEVRVIGKHDSEPPLLAGGQVTQGVRLGLLGNTDNMDAPVNAVGYSAGFIENQQARTVGDVLANDASVRYVSQPGGILDAFSIRGFPVGNGNFGEIAFDGIYGVASNYRVATSYIERVELIKGPTAVLTGMAPSGSVGGGIKGDIAPGSASNAGEVFAPYKSRQYEVGARFGQGGMRATVSAFQISKPAGELAGPVFAVNGEQRSRGLEFGLYGEPAGNVRLLASAALLDATITRDADAGTVARSVIGAPSLQVNLGAEWDAAWLPGLTLSGTLAYTGRQYVDQANTQSLPAWTRVDLGARYRITMAGKDTTLRLYLRNVFDRRYWAAVDSYGGLAIGEPRTLMMSATVGF
ncbi:TonB-dependent receptor [Cupriavidus necator]|uniref:TonB-dependent receptor n=1 Tax=Cupriavidus necator TaxID=106590 RepID=A0A1U9UWD5_CUPNE|nr:TonB-dependent receptor [Cupriavidus necator]AQV97006.1 TonB-dependent receptor [Cupriavidus necator]